MFYMIENKFGMTLQTAMIAKMMYKNLKKKTEHKHNEEQKKIKKMESNILKELIQSQLKN